MYRLRLIPFFLAAILIMAACAGQPAAENTGAAEPASVEETAADETAMEDTAQDDGAADEGMDAGADHADDMSSDDMAGEESGEDAAGSDMSDGMSDMEASGDAGMDTASAEEASAASDRPAWQQIPLTDARTGESFTLAGYAGKTVFVEPFATWCSNCRRQLGNVQQAYATLGDDVVFVALSVEPNIADEALVSYADKEGFEYTFAAMPQEMLQELAAIFGQTVSNPPATPHFIIRPDGSTTDLVTGIEAPDVLVEQIQAATG